MIQISLVYDHHKRTPKGEEGPVEVRVTVNRKPYYINTGVRVKKGMLVANAVRDDEESTNADILNERLTTIVALVEKEVNKCLEEQRPIDVAEIRRKVWNISPATDDEKDEPTMINWIKSYIATANVSKSTKKRYITVCNCLMDFGQMVRWEQLTPNNIYAWDVWLRQRPIPLTENQKLAGVEEAHISNDSAYNYHKVLKAAINKALQFDIVTSNPYDRMKGAFKRDKRETVDYLTEEQMQKILELTPVPGSQAAMARDLFIFQMFTGLGYADTQIFDIGNYREVDGRWQFVGERIKTGVPYVSMLLPPVVEVLKRNGWKVPRMNNQRYNQMLKVIGMVVGIERLHSHMGRHSFATMMLSKGAKIENVSRMLGHTTVKQTERYAKVLAKDVYDDFDKVAAKLDKPLLLNELPELKKKG
jgi:integrase